MSRWRKIDAKFWLDEKIRELSSRAKLVCLFLMTHPHLTMLGAMRATVPGLSAELDPEGSPEAFREAFEEVLRIGIAKYDSKASFLWLPNFLRYNKPESPNVVRAWPGALDLLPECELKGQLFEQLKAFVKGLSEGFLQAFNEAFPKTSRIPEPEPEPNKEGVNSPLPSKTSPNPEAFVSAWNDLRGSSLPGVQKLTSGRRDKLRKRTAEGLTLGLFILLVKQCAATPFLRGDNPRGWRVSFDWLIESEKNMLKVKEANYDDHKGAPDSSEYVFSTGDPFSGPEYQDPVGGVQ